MSMPEHDDFFRRLGKKLDAEWSFEQLPEEWAQIAAQIPGKPEHKKHAWWWWLFLLLLGVNIAWYMVNRQLRNELKETTAALVAARKIMESNPPAPVLYSSPGSIAEPETQVRSPKSLKPAITTIGLKNVAIDLVSANTDNGPRQDKSVELPDSVDVKRNAAPKNLLFPIPQKELLFNLKPSLYLVRLQDEMPVLGATKENGRPGNWKLSPLVGYNFMGLDRQHNTGGLQVGLNFSRRLIGSFFITAGLTHHSWQFGLDNPESPLVGAADESCPYCPSDTILVNRKQWSTTVSLTYEKNITNWLGVQLDAGWTYVPKFDQLVTFRYVPAYGGPHLTVVERKISVPAYSLAHVRAGLVFPASARLAGLLAAQYDIPLEKGKIGWWSLQAGWQFAF